MKTKARQCDLNELMVGRDLRDEPEMEALADSPHVGMLRHLVVGQTVPSPADTPQGYRTPLEAAVAGQQGHATSGPHQSHASVS